MFNTQKIHFINNIDEHNTGDMATSPLNYFFDFFKSYNIIGHNVDCIKWMEISTHDIVIIGGGGLLYLVESWQKNIARLCEINLNVIAWGVGFNTHYGQPICYPLDITRFKLIGIRDYQHPSSLPYLPCVSCLAKELRKKIPTRREVGIVEHAAFPIDGFTYEKISNAHNFQTITDFIASSKVILSSSYHIVYWATLMGKRTICINPFSTKFEYFKYKPIFYSGNLEADITKTAIYEGCLEEAIELNNLFFDKVKEIVCSVIADKDNEYQKIYEMNRYVILNRALEDYVAQNPKPVMEKQTKRYPKWLIKLLCIFIPKKKNRARLRDRHMKQNCEIHTAKVSY
ncbi:MAG: polysaccharide pyruvyl transferase family protein [Puniceicoccales bacterium]|nr:polysaccharide pyruvyl transferase family protein [Puniceicoccales bacterium]